MNAEAGAERNGAALGKPLTFARLRRRLMGSSLIRHNILMFVVNMATSAFAYLYHPIIGHLLGNAGYGTIISLSALSTVLLIPSQVITNIANKFAADLSARGRLDELNYLFRRLTYYTLVAGLLATGLFIAFSPIIAAFLKLSSTQIVVFASFGYVLSFSGALNVGVIQGRQQFKWFAFLNLLGTFLRLPVTVLVLIASFGIDGLIISSAVQGILLYFLGFLPMRDFLKAPQVRVPSLKPLLVYSLASTLALGGDTLLVNTDTILAKTFLSPNDAGDYAAIVTVGRVVLFVGGSLVWVMFPKVAALQQEGRSHTGILAATMAGVGVLSASVLGVFWLFPDQVIGLILKEIPPAPVAHLVIWFGLSMFFLSLANVLIYYFLSLGRMAFVSILLACCVLQALLITRWHQNIAQMVYVMVVVMGVLLAGLLALYMFEMLGKKIRKDKGVVHA